MKSVFTILTILVAAVAVSPRQTFGQYAWVPVYSDSASSQASDSESESDQTGYATHIYSDLENFDKERVYNDADCKGGACKKGKGGKGDCNCPSCRGGDWLNRSFFNMEYLHWWNSGRNLPPLVTGGPNGILPGAPILFGNDEVGDQLQAGGRLTAGMWLDDCQNSAVVIRAFGNEGDNTVYAAAAPGVPFLAVPFNNTFPPAGLGPNSVVIGDAGIGLPGAIAASASNDVLGGDIYYRTMVDAGCDFRVDLLGGFQYSRIDDDLTLATASPGDGGANPAFDSLDIFDVSNQFTGGELGLLGEFYQGPVTIQLMGKIGVGNMRQKVAISGAGNFAGIPTPGGIFAQNANNGFDFNARIYDRDVLAWSPEASVKMIWNLRENVSISVGYTFLYWTNVALAGDHVDTSINAPVIFGAPPTANNPSFAFRDTDFWVQTIDIGFAFNY